MLLPEYVSITIISPLLPFAFLHDSADTPVPTQKQWFTETFQHLSAIATSAEAADAGVHLVSG